MSRIGRIYQRTLCYHVMDRGVNRAPLFSDDADREYFSGLVNPVPADRPSAPAARP
jgi:hypothetical protein